MTTTKKGNNRMNLKPPKRRKRKRDWKQYREARRLMEEQHLDSYQHLTNEHAARVLVGAIAIHHPAVIMPKEWTFSGFLRANPREDFLRRLAAANN